MTFELNKPVGTEEPTVEVDGRKKVGRYRFQLVVEDRAGQHSEPFVWTVIVERP